MTTPELRVTPVGLHALAQRCETLAGQVGVSLSPVTASVWQSSGAAATAVNAGATRVGMALKARMTASATKLTKAAQDYENQDEHGRAALAGVGCNSCPGGYSGVDGDAAAFPTPR